MPLDERTAIIVGPDAALASIIGRAFDPARSFPLPRALDALRSVFAFAVSLEGPKAGLVVGHTAPETEDAEALSKRRADVLAAWLIADPEPWLANFKDSVPEEQRWGSREDRLMLRQVPELRDAKVAVRASSPNAAKADPRRDELVAQYQGLRALTVDGIAGPITRKALILDYFVVSRTAQRADDDQSDSAEAKKPVRFELDVAAHGAGAAFAPEDTDAESAADTASADPLPTMLPRKTLAPRVATARQVRELRLAPGPSPQRSRPASARTSSSSSQMPASIPRPVQRTAQNSPSGSNFRP